MCRSGPLVPVVSGDLHARRTLRAPQPVDPTRARQNVGLGAHAGEGANGRGPLACPVATAGRVGKHHGTRHIENDRRPTVNLRVDSRPGDASVVYGGAPIPLLVARDPQFSPPQDPRGGREKRNSKLLELDENPNKKKKEVFAVSLLLFPLSNWRWIGHWTCSDVPGVFLGCLAV